MDNLDHYLYFPQCKISRVDHILGSDTFTFFIKSLKNSPKHYPQHFMLEGKADFFFKLNNLSYDKLFSTIFGHILSPTNLPSFQNKKVSVLAYFDPDAKIKLQCIGIGIAGEIPILFNDVFYIDDCKQLAQTAFFHYELPKVIEEEKKHKI